MAPSKALLKKMLIKYKHREVTLRQILTVMEVYTSLVPALDTYNYNDGSRQELMNLSGTVPVTYRGCVYNIPVEMWLLHTHPAHPPLTFVRPTLTMVIRAGRTVDCNGRVYLPYLSDWGEDSDVLGLVQVMSVEFGLEPPVRSIGHGVTASPAYWPGSHPVSGSPVSYPVCQASPSDQVATAVYANQPPLPPPPRAGSVLVTQSERPPLSRAPTVTREHLRASLVSAILDRLRALERERGDRARAELAALERSGRELRAGGDRIRSLLAALERETTQVDTCIRALRAAATPRPPPRGVALGASRCPGGSVDGVVEPRTPLHGQIAELHAEDGAIADTAFIVAEGLACAVLGLEAFLKSVRLLARRQFLVRALIIKARISSGLSELC